MVALCKTLATFFVTLLFLLTAACSRDQPVPTAPSVQAFEALRQALQSGDDVAVASAAIALMDADQGHGQQIERRFYRVQAALLQGKVDPESERLAALRQAYPRILDLRWTASALLNLWLAADDAERAEIATELSPLIEEAIKSFEVLRKVLPEAESLIKGEVGPFLVLTLTHVGEPEVLGEDVEIEALVVNAGDTPAEDVKASLTPKGLYLQSAGEHSLGQLRGGQSTVLFWRVALTADGLPNSFDIAVKGSNTNADFAGGDVALAH